MLPLPTRGRCLGVTLRRKLSRCPHPPIPCTFPPGTPSQPRPPLSWEAWRRCVSGPGGTQGGESGPCPCAYMTRSLTSFRGRVPPASGLRPPHTSCRTGGRLALPRLPGGLELRDHGLQGLLHQPELPPQGLWPPLRNPREGTGPLRVRPRKSARAGGRQVGTAV